jgi:solute:Na+ symporter, SSS family
MTIYILAGFALYVGSLVFIGIKNRKASGTGAVSYFLAGRSYSFIIYLATSVASLRSFFYFFGSGREWWVNGVGFFIVTITNSIALPMMMYIFGPRMWVLSHKYDHVTPGDMLGHRYESTAVRVLVAFVALLFTLPYIQLQLEGAGELLELLTTGADGVAMIPYAWGSALTAGVVVMYVVLGGGRAVGWSDVVQSFLFILVMLFVGWTVWNYYGGTERIFTAFRESENLQKALTLPGTSGTQNYGIWTTRFLAFAMGFAALNTWNKTYSAASPKVIRQVAAVLPIFLLISYLPTMMYSFGAMTEYHMMDTPRKDFLLYFFFNDHMQQIGYIILLAAFAAGMSTLDVVLLSVSAVATKDIYQGWFKQKSDPVTTARIGRWVVLGVCILAWVLAMNRGLGLARLGILSYSGTANLIFPLIGATFWARATKWGVIAGLIGGTSVTLLTDGLIFGGPESWIGQLFLTDLGFYTYIYPPFAGLVVNLILFVGVSLLTRPTSQKTQDEFFGVLRRAFPKKSATSK